MQGKNSAEKAPVIQLEEFGYGIDNPAIKHNAFVAVFTRHAHPWKGYTGLPESVQNMNFPIILTVMDYNWRIGFPGGKVEKENLTLDILKQEALREAEEEINLSGIDISEIFPVCSHSVTNGSGQTSVSHLFGIEADNPNALLRIKPILRIQGNAADAIHFGSEILGTNQLRSDMRFKDQDFNGFFRTNLARTVKEEVFELWRLTCFLPLDEIERLQKHHAPEYRRPAGILTPWPEKYR